MTTTSKKKSKSEPEPDVQAWSSEQAASAAMAFAGSATARSWYLFSDDIRSAMLDAWVMREIRVACIYIAAPDRPANADLRKIIAFRKMVQDYIEKNNLLSD